MKPRRRLTGPGRVEELSGTLRQLFIYSQTSPSRQSSALHLDLLHSQTVTCAVKNNTGASTLMQPLHHFPSSEVFRLPPPVFALSLSLTSHP